jgi:hypothetical protein
LRPTNIRSRTFLYIMLNIQLRYIYALVELIEGNLPKKQIKLALAWAELHQEELMRGWDLVMNGKEPFKIQPLQ